jgi:hypothetical protein
MRVRPVTKTWIYTIFLMVLGFFYHWLLIRVGDAIFYTGAVAYVLVASFVAERYGR